MNIIKAPYSDNKGDKASVTKVSDGSDLAQFSDSP